MMQMKKNNHDRPFAYHGYFSSFASASPTCIVCLAFIYPELVCSLKITLSVYYIYFLPDADPKG